MVRIREARRAFGEFHTQCFWYMRRDMTVTLDDLPEIIRGLRENGGRRGLLVAARLADHGDSSRGAETGASRG